MFPFDDVIMNLNVVCSQPFQVYGPRDASENLVVIHDDAMLWKRFPRYQSFVKGIHRSAVVSLHKKGR